MSKGPSGRETRPRRAMAARASNGPRKKERSSIAAKGHGVDCDDDTTRACLLFLFPPP